MDLRARASGDFTIAPLSYPSAPGRSSSAPVQRLTTYRPKPAADAPAWYHWEICDEASALRSLPPCIDPAAMRQECWDRRNRGARPNVLVPQTDSCRISCVFERFEALPWESCPRCSWERR